MARPQRKNAEYFSHDANMRNDAKVRAIRTRFGAAGYGIYCMLLEILAGSDDFHTEWDEMMQEIYAGDMGISAAEMNELVSFCIKIKLFSLENGVLECPILTEGLRPLVEKRAKLRQKYEVENETSVVSAAETTLQDSLSEVSAAETPQSKEEYSKVKKSKEEDLRERERAGEPECADEPDNGDEHPPPIPSFRRPEWRLLATRRTVDLDELMQDFVIAMDRIPREFVELWWLHYESTNWLDGTGKVVEAAEKIRLKWRNGKERPQQQFSQSHGSIHHAGTSGAANSGKPKSGYEQRLALNAATFRESIKANEWLNPTGRDIGIADTDGRGTDGT